MTFTIDLHFDNIIAKNSGILPKQFRLGYIPFGPQLPEVNLILMRWPYGDRRLLRRAESVVRVYRNEVVEAGSEEVGDASVVTVAVEMDPVHVEPNGIPLVEVERYIVDAEAARPSKLAAVRPLREPHARKPVEP